MCLFYIRKSKMASEIRNCYRNIKLYYIKVK